jgi:hypothetical protein
LKDQSIFLSRPGLIMNKPPRSNLLGNPLREGRAGESGPQVVQVQAKPADLPAVQDVEAITKEGCLQNPMQ